MQHIKAPETLKRVAQEVMAEHHVLLDQRGPRIEWVMAKPEKPSGSAPDWKIRKVTGVQAFLALDDSERPEEWGFPVESLIAVEVSAKYWEGLNTSQREALCDHVMAHMVYDYEKGSWRVEGPEFGEFKDVLRRRGFWRPDKRLRRFAESVSEQLSLLPDEPEEDEDAGDEENVEVSLTFGDRTVHTDTDTMNRAARDLEGAARGSADTMIVNGRVVDKETGEVLEGSRA